jgi:hypothetical protein
MHQQNTNLCLFALTISPIILQPSGWRTFKTHDSTVRIKGVNVIHPR